MEKVLESQLGGARGSSVEKYKALACSIIHLAKPAAVSFCSLEISLGRHEGRCSYWHGSSLFSSVELSAARKQLSVGPAPIMGCKGRQLLCEKGAWNKLPPLQVRDRPQSAGPPSCIGKKCSYIAKCCPSWLIIRGSKELVGL